jgi:hypothetical protein
LHTPVLGGGIEVCEVRPDNIRLFRSLLGSNVVEATIQFSTNRVYLEVILNELLGMSLGEMGFRLHMFMEVVKCSEAHKAASVAFGWRRDRDLGGQGDFLFQVFLLSLLLGLMFLFQVVSILF